MVWFAYCSKPYMDRGGYVAKRLFPNLVPEIFAPISLSPYCEWSQTGQQRRSGNKAKLYTTLTTIWSLTTSCLLMEMGQSLCISMWQKGGQLCNHGSTYLKCQNKITWQHTLFTAWHILGFLNAIKVHTFHFLYPLVWSLVCLYILSVLYCLLKPFKP